MKKATIAVLVFTFSVLRSAQQPQTINIDLDKTEGKLLIGRFLIFFGNNELDLVPKLFCEN